MARSLPLLSIPAFICLLICLFTAVAYGRFIFDDVEDGSTAQTTSFLRLNALHAASDSCEKTYGFMPCTNSAIGNVFLIIVYGYLMFLSATYLSNGSELLLEILGPGLVGGLFLPMLGALPDSMLILVSGLSVSSKTTQSQVSVGMGLLAGSTVMLLTVIWGTCVIVGKCDLQGTITIDGKDTVGVSLTGSGVSTDIWTSYAAILMVISLVPFLIVQIPQVMNSTSGRHLAVLIALVVSLLLLVSYCVYQVFQPWIQRRRLAYAKHKHIISGVLKHLKMRGLDRLFNDDGQPNERVIEKLFEVTDSDGDNYLSSSELKALILGIRFDETNMDEDDAIDKIMKDFDTSGDSRVDYNEFKAGISRWLDEAIKFKSGSHRSCPDDTLQHFTEFHEHTRHEHNLLGNQIDETGEEDGVENTKWTSIKAVFLLLFGTVVAAAFADPLVDAVDSFSIATSIPTFFISFVVLPLATNSSEAVSAIIFASRKNKRSASLTFSEIYGAVTMNNLMCLSVFLGLVYIKELTWDFSSEVLVILLVCLLMGIFASLRTTFPLWSCLVAFLLYPFSLAVVYVLDYVFGWS